jgi:hypothetical protein
MNSSTRAVRGIGAEVSELKPERPCKAYERGDRCKDADGRDHCFNCGRHLDGNLVCPKGCGADERINQAAIDGCES